MPSEKRSYSVLVVSGKKQDCDFISAMLQSFEYRPVDIALSAGEARRKLSRCSYDIMIIDSPLPDEFGHDFAIDAASKSRSGVMLMVKKEIFGRVCVKVEDYGILTVPKPISKSDFYIALKLVTSTSARLLKEEKKAESLQEKIEEIRLVNRAKYILMDKKGMTEPEAHRFIEKSAMDTRSSKRDIARDIIDNE